MKSRARCVPLQYLSSATCGVKQALNSNKELQSQNSIVVSTLLQERKTEKVSNPLKAVSQSSGQASQTESGMYYELSNKRRMECERYQDCSWFQQDSMKGNISSTLSLAEGAGPIIDTNEFDLAMQLANAQSISWEDEYLEVFDDDIFLEVNNKMGDKNKSPSSTDYYSNVNCKTGDDSVYDAYNINFSLRKTDSFDSMKNISSTNPAEIIPISYKERLNNSNYGPAMLSDVKCEVKEEVDLYSPESNSYIVESDDSGLNIGREEVVEEVNSDEYAQVATKKEKIDVKALKITTNVLPLEKESINIKSQENIVLKNSKENEIIKVENGNNDNSKVPEEKLDLNLDLNKVGFEQSMNVSTPDLDFMDLVEYINEEMHQEHGNPSSIPHSQTKFPTNQNIQSSKDISNIENIQPVNPIQNSSAQNQILVKKAVNNEIPSSDLMAVSLKENSTVDFNKVSDKSVSIAERIKMSAKRRLPRKYNVKEVEEECSESDEGDDFDDDDDEDDEDYDYAEDTAKRKLAPLRKRSKSSASESSSSSGKRTDLTRVNTYRERRDKNNEASRRSRQNRKDRERQMFQTLETEERRNVKLKAESEVLEKQVTSLRQLLLQVVLKKGNGT